MQCCQESSVNCQHLYAIKVEGYCSNGLPISSVTVRGIMRVWDSSPGEISFAERERIIEVSKFTSFARGR
jgi:hypothetical protein